MSVILIREGVQEAMETLFLNQYYNILFLYIHTHVYISIYFI